MPKFVNNYYHDEWAQEVPGTGAPYREGSYIEGGWAVYDGAQNWMGRIEKNGNIIYNGSRSDYKETFLQAAKEVLIG